ncbi:unnamed protein product [Vitrella brassicaformis CCMP3155]|uniref:NYN domain-containing protein n=2 Tax=Vitrella brassicaformis TaxID=1169539 RepID=A0A0G4GKG0_VITBC|nr:unnamed protein product [Vitrella brassicaformis CCMP3155]|eukprot:CEM30503.1 unnamed protein product [Vitrella brassicaformis CCMP3155]
MAASSAAYTRQQGHSLRCALIVDGANALKGFEKHERRLMRHHDFEAHIREMLVAFEANTGRSMQLVTDHTIFVNVDPQEYKRFISRHLENRYSGEELDYRRRQLGNDSRRMAELHNRLGRRRSPCRFKIKTIGLKSREVRCHNCRCMQEDHVQRGGDVMIAMCLLEAALRDDIDPVILFSGDGDFMPALQSIRQAVPTKKIFVAAYEATASRRFSVSDSWELRDGRWQPEISRHIDHVHLIRTSDAAAPPPPRETLPTLPVDDRAYAQALLAILLERT